tara:strand:- start:309 stop:563 length:255 start_codon:yes stop_codon:yes gene_type:complete
LELGETAGAWATAPRIEWILRTGKVLGAQFSKRNLLPRTLPDGPFAVAELKLDFIVRFFGARDEALALGVASRRLKGCEFHLVQ